MTIDVPIRLPTFEEGFSPDPGGVGILIDPIPELWDRISMVFAGSNNKKKGGSGQTWPVQRGGNCKQCAERIQDLIGGILHRIEPEPPNKRLGPSVNNPDGDWAYHYAVEKGGRVYDSFTGPGGISLGEYKNQWEYQDAIQFGF